VEFTIQSLVVEHREIEALLDLFAEGITSGTIDMDAFRRVHRLCIRHYQGEEAFLVRLAAQDAALAAKLRGQHDEALELAALLEETAITSLTDDGIYLARRFLAIAQHNIIEEERDVFPFFGDA
jgi:Hemerythrin HHE cation binding domain